MDLNMEIADYTVASHGSTIPLLVYREIQEDWDFLGNTDNHLLTNTMKTIQDDLDKSFTNRQHKNIMAITTPFSHFTLKDKEDILDAVANESPLPEKWAFLDEKGHKCTTYAWLTGNDSPKTSIAPTTSFSPVTGQKCPLETKQEPEDIGYMDKLNAIKYCLPLPQSTVNANLDFWTTTINKCLNICRPLHPEINPIVLCSSFFHTAEKLMAREYFVNKVRKLARSQDPIILQDFADEHLRVLQQEINFQNTDQTMETNNNQDTVMQDSIHEPSKIDLIQKTTLIWKNTVKTLWNKNILTCKQETLDQAARLLPLGDTTHKYASLTEAQIYNMEIDHQESIITLITELNENAAKAIDDIHKKSVPSVSVPIKNQAKVKLIKKQGWEAVKKAVLQKLSSFFPPNISPECYSKIVTDITEDLKSQDDNS
ncbi:hypothetical protein AMATHDRAFT_9563 [Amanita thiersii Skay4041]|uniref:Uncharacterized protein n=1 Tax=Amanita thiersii Skay4041 TaxID=703135 RepID=A0A2A9N6I5_9AGAR|nr:hypothetical protein AMATHDRAFT_9563 [Amanita thiersii Skay4041]